MVTMALRASLSPERSIWFSSSSRYDESLLISRSSSPLTFSPSRANSNSVSTSEVNEAIFESFSICSSSRLRSCMIFWLFSGLDQKSGALICSSSWLTWDFRLGASKIAPHSVGLGAERGVFAVEFVEGHRYQCSARVNLGCDPVVRQMCV